MKDLGRDEDGGKAYIESTVNSIKRAIEESGAWRGQCGAVNAR